MLPPASTAVTVPVNATPVATLAGVLNCRWSTGPTTTVTFADPVIAELAVITWIRRRYMDTPWVSAALQVGLGGALVFITGVLIGIS